MRANHRLGAAVAAIALAISGCAVVKDHKAKVTLQKTPPIHLAVIPKSVGLDYWTKVHEGAMCAARQLPGVEGHLERGD